MRISVFTPSGQIATRPLDVQSNTVMALHLGLRFRTYMGGLSTVYLQVETLYLRELQELTMFHQDIGETIPLLQAPPRPWIMTGTVRAMSLRSSLRDCR